MALKTLLITQARMGSTRLPGKILKEINGETLLKIHLDRIKKSTSVTDFLVATTINEEDEIIYNNAIHWGFQAYRGSVNDVLDRFYQASKIFQPDWVVRVTSDCPLIDASLIDKIIAFARNNDADYGSNTLKEEFPDGQDIEVFKFSTLEKAWNEAKKKSEREHVTTYIKNNSSFLGGKIFSSVNYPCEKNFSNIRMTVDESRDVELINRLVDDLGLDKTWMEYAEYIISKNLITINQDIIRNEGLLKSLKND